MTRNGARHAFSACCAIFCLLYCIMIYYCTLFFFFIQIGLIYLHIIDHGICLKIITLHFPWYNLFPDGGSKEVLNHNEYLQLRDRWWGQLWHLFYFFMVSKNIPSQPLSLFVCLLEPGPGVYSLDALKETGEGRNRSPWLIPSTMLSTGGRKASCS